MLNYLIQLFTPRLGAVLASFEKTIAKLEKVALHQTELAAKKALAWVSEKAVSSPTIQRSLFLMSLRAK